LLVRPDHDCCPCEVQSREGNDIFEAAVIYEKEGDAAEEEKELDRGGGEEEEEEEAGGGGGWWWRKKEEAKMVDRCGHERKESWW